MKTTVLPLLLPLLIFAGLFPAGCSPSEPEKHPLYLKAAQLRSEGNPVEAEGYLRRYLERVPDSALGHLALASLYDETLGNPTSALYHYEEYLRLVPEDAADRATVEHYRQLVRAKLLKELSGEPLPVVPAAVLAAENRQLRRTNDQLKRYIQNQNRKIAELLNGAPASVPSPSVSSGPRTYTVRQGDTPGKIAQRFYGTASKYPKIMEANHLTGSGNLRVGQQLIIPE